VGAAREKYQFKWRLDGGWASHVTADLVAHFGYNGGDYGGGVIYLQEGFMPITVESDNQGRSSRLHGTAAFLFF